MVRHCWKRGEREAMLGKGLEVWGLEKGRSVSRVGLEGRCMYTWVRVEKGDG